MDADTSDTAVTRCTMVKGANLAPLYAAQRAVPEQQSFSQILHVRNVVSGCLWMCVLQVPVLVSCCAVPPHYPTAQPCILSKVQDRLFVSCQL